MRRSRRGGHSGLEFGGGSGEDSFVAVVVTKLTGALLFILLLSLVIMALLPKAMDMPRPRDASEADEAPPLAIATPEALPEAIAGRPYAVALAATGGSGPLRWGLDGTLPEGLSFDPEFALLAGTPKAGTPEPVGLLLRVTDGHDRASRPAKLVVYQPQGPLTTPSRWKPALPPLPWRAWLGQGFGFLLLLLVHMVGMNALGALERWSAGHADPENEDDARAVRRRFAGYRWLVRLASLAAAAGLAAWLATARV